MTRSLIYAHRGANKEAAENTRSAFDKALAYAIDGMETDVQLTRDEVAVLWHDRFLDKVGLPDKHIDDFKFDELRALNFAGYFVDPKHKSIMSLQEFIDAYRTRCRLLIEIKNREWESPDRHQIKVRQTLDRIGATTDNSIIVSSFNLTSLIYANQYRPGFPLIHNFEEDQTAADVAQVLIDHPFLHGLCLPIATLNQAVVQLLRDSNKCIAVYTCNSDEEISKALELEVEILISDVPEKALALRNK
ncbi:MAG: glycerophosphodiester phosphodiesterase [Nitrosomonadales bacterium]